MVVGWAVAAPDVGVGSVCGTWLLAGKDQVLEPDPSLVGLGTAGGIDGVVLGGWTVEDDVVRVRGDVSGARVLKRNVLGHLVH